MAINALTELMQVDDQCQRRPRASARLDFMISYRQYAYLDADNSFICGWQASDGGHRRQSDEPFRSAAVVDLESARQGHCVAKPMKLTVVEGFADFTRPPTLRASAST